MQTTSARAVALASTIVAVFETAFPGDSSLDRALKARDAHAAQQCLQRAATEAETTRERKRRVIVWAAADAAEAVCLALSKQPNLPDVRDAVQSARSPVLGGEA